MSGDGVGAAERRPREDRAITLHALVEFLGQASVTSVAVPSWSLPVRTVRVFESEADFVQEAVLLCPGARAADVPGLVRSLGAAGGSALVVRAGAVRGAAVRREVSQAVAEAGVAVLVLDERITWLSAAADCRALMASPVPDVLGLRYGALIDEVIDAVALLLDAPVILTDPQHRLLAFSDRQDTADEPNRWVIVHRRLPEVTVTGLKDDGGEEQLRRGTDPVYIPAYPQYGNEPKLGVPIHGGGEFLGVLWVHGAAPPTEEDRRRLAPAVDAIAVQLLRVAQYRAALRAGYTEDVRALLRGGDAVGAVAGRQGMAGYRLGVVALVPLVGTPTGTGDGAGDLERVRTSLAVYLTALHERSKTAVLDGAVYGIVPMPGSAENDPEHWLTEVARDFLERVDAAGALVAGVGRVARTAEEVPLARKDADLAAYALRSRPDGATRAVPLADVRAEAVLLQAARSVAADHGRLDGPVARLASADEQQGSRLVETLRCYLDAFGNVAAAAAHLHVHPNTLRQRLHRICAVSGLDLDSPHDRFAAGVELRLLELPDL
ncbi:PucR family transcriptional regulator [Streptomyces ipomoeae]|uniref:PucR family transcriptional regulator n=1 Tax=Streptomyces ipomoeae TaxID=103232 RepID=UPI00114674B8|nr:PucR family transcriptional regulator [Streptomyces ipomoeae]MDX2937760.1 helix-turn-helix domain-containing protein [Streptomyces ipomoeae]TQE17235.1 PucR family transcriptional regulator [Streptomyces ipomoeae]